MEWAYAAQGLGMGLAYVAPIGMQNLFVINSALTQRPWRAAATTLCVTLCDISLALACFFGVGVLLEQSALLKMGVLAAGAVLVLRIGWQLLRAGVEKGAEPAGEMPLPRAALAACAVTWLNPQAVLDGTMMLGAFRAALPPESGLSFLAGVCTASCLWFSGLTCAARLVQAWLTPAVLHRVNQVCGVVSMAYALKLVWALVELL